MTRPWGTALAVLLTASSLWAAPNGITLVGKGLVSGTALDKSGLNGSICQAGVPTNCVPKAIFGGFGSDLDRVHFLHITTNLGAPFPNIQTTLLDTRLFENESGQTFVGAAGAFDLDEELATLRLDPEGIRIGYNGHIYI
jgi:hypothetical protein